MKHALHSYKLNRAGFTLVEIIIVVAVIALLAAIAAPNFQRARKRGQAVRILNDLRIIDYALDRWAIENGKSGTDSASMTDLRGYLKTGTALYNSGTDILGNAYGPTFVVDIGPKISLASYRALSDTVPVTFWSPFY